MIKAFLALNVTAEIANGNTHTNRNQCTDTIKRAIPDFLGVALQQFVLFHFHSPIKKGLINVLNLFRDSGKNGTSSRQHIDQSPLVFAGLPASDRTIANAQPLSHSDFS